MRCIAIRNLSSYSRMLAGAERKLLLCLNARAAVVERKQLQPPIVVVAATVTIRPRPADPSNALTTAISMKMPINTESAAMQTDAAANTPAAAGILSGPSLRIPDGSLVGICMTAGLIAAIAAICKTVINLHNKKPKRLRFGFLFGQSVSSKR